MFEKTTNRYFFITQSDYTFKIVTPIFSSPTSPLAMSNIDGLIDVAVKCF